MPRRNERRDPEQNTRDDLRQIGRFPAIHGCDNNARNGGLKKLPTKARGEKP
jgi:hypothetical protein